MTSFQVRVGGAIATGVLLLIVTAPVQAQTASLATRLPRGANTVLTVDVTKFLQSPLGKKEELQSKMISGYADRPLAVPATARRLAIGAAVHPTGMDSIWQAAVIDVSTAPRLEPMLRAQGGYLDKIEGKNAAWTSRDIFYIELDDHTLGVVQPGQRQFVRRWLAGKGDTGLSPYLSTAITAAGDADAVFAVDLDDVIGLGALKYAFGMGQLPSLEKVQSGQDKLMQALAAVKGMTITMRVTDRINAEWIIDFEQNVSALGSQAKEFVIDVLTAADLYEGGVDQWDFKAEGNRIVGKGTMGLDDLNRLIALLSPADVGATDAAGAAPSLAKGTAEPRPTPQPEPANPAALASQKYYRAVAKILDSIGPKPSPKQSASWLVAQSRMIQQLPVLHVDPALVQWGNQVSTTFTRAAQELGLGQQKSMVASQGIATPVSTVAYTESGEGGSTDTPESRAAFKNAQQQRRQVAQAERGVAAERAFNIVNEILGTRGQIRTEMVQKYGIEF